MCSLKYWIGISGIPARCKQAHFINDAETFPQIRMEVFDSYCFIFSPIQLQVSKGSGGPDLQGCWSTGGDASLTEAVLNKASLPTCSGHAGLRTLILFTLYKELSIAITQQMAKRNRFVIWFVQRVVNY